MVDEGAATSSGTKENIARCEINLAPSLSTTPSPPNLTSPLLANAGADSKADLDRCGSKLCDFLRQWPTLIFSGAETVSNILPCPALSPSGASQDAHLLHFPPRLNPPLRLSPQARLLELIDWDVREFAMTELLSPQVTTAWRSDSEITFVLVDDFSSM